MATDYEQRSHEWPMLPEVQLIIASHIAAASDLLNAVITKSGLKIIPLDTAVPDTTWALMDRTTMVPPRIKITGPLLEVDEWTGFTRYFTHLKSSDLAGDKNLLLTTIPADTTDLDLTRVAESYLGTTHAKLA